MKAKVLRGAGFRGVLDYVFDQGKGHERVGGNLAGRDAREMASEFGALRELRPDIERPVWHCSLSLPAGERLSAERWERVSSDFMSRMGFTEATPYVAVRHQDTQHDHVHIVASRIDATGRVWHGQWEARRAIEATQALEREHGLALTEGLGKSRNERRRLTDREINRAVRTGEEPPRQRLQNLVSHALEGRPTAVEFAERLELAGVEVRANLASTGRMSGFSFAIDGVAFKGQQLGANYTWKELQKRGLRYEQGRDRAGLERFGAASANRGDGGRSPDEADRDVERPRGTAERDLGGASSGARAATEVARGRAGARRASRESEGRDRDREHKSDNRDPKVGNGPNATTEGGRDEAANNASSMGATRGGGGRADGGDWSRRIRESAAERDAARGRVATPHVDPRDPSRTRDDPENQQPKRTVKRGRDPRDPGMER